MKRIGVVTVARSDYGILRPLLRALAQEAGFELQVIAAAGHFPAVFGRTLSEIEQDGFPIAARVDMTLASDSEGSAARAMGLGMIGFAAALESLRPDLLVILGDRYEMLAAAAAAAVMQVPIAHIAGGTVSLGAVDDSLRNAITKLASVHFAETESCAARLLRMGEVPWRVRVTGALGLDTLRSLPLMTLDAVNERFGIGLKEPPILVTFHPATREPDRAGSQAAALTAALERLDRPILATYPNADAGGRAIIAALDDLADRRPDTVAVVPHLGTHAYFSLMALAPAMVGNSSSGIVEAASFGLPVVDIGARQQGRECGPNVIHVPACRDAILAGIAHALSPEFRASLGGLVNPYGMGEAAPRMLDVLRSLDLKDPALLRKEPA